MAYIKEQVYIKSSFTNKYFLSLFDVDNVGDFYDWFDANEHVPLVTKRRIFEASILEFYADSNASQSETSVSENNQIILSDSMNKYIDREIVEVILALYGQFKSRINFTQYNEEANEIMNSINKTKAINSYIIHLNKENNKTRKQSKQHMEIMNMDSDRYKSLYFYLMIYIHKKIDKHLKKLTI